MSYQEAAISFLKMVAEGKIQQAYDQFIAPNFIHHNQYFPGDRQSLLTGMQEAGKKNPHKVLTVKKTFVDGNFVITHSHVRQNPEDLGVAVVHIFKFENQKIIEMWDLGQALIANSPNHNGAF